MPHRACLIWVKFPTVWSLTRVKCPGIARGGWAVLELTGTFFFKFTLASGVLHYRVFSHSFVARARV